MSDDSESRDGGVGDFMKNSQPPESRMKKTFIKGVKEAQGRIKKGKGKIYTPQEFEAKFCG